MQVNTYVQNHIVIIGVEGQIDSYTAPTLEKHLQKILDEGNSRMVLDLEGVSYVSSAGLRAISLICRAARQIEDGGDIRLARPPQVVAQALRTSGFDQVFRIYDSIDEATARF